MARTKDNVEVLYIEAVEQGDSGFVLDGTEHTPYEQRLHAPTVTWIPTEGIEVYIDPETKIKRHKKIRHIKKCESIYPLEQEKNGFTPNRNDDKIPMENGFATIRREGGTISTFDYLKAATYFWDNPLRPDTATAIYKEVKLDERAVDVINDDELLTVAKSKVYALRINTGGKTFKYEEDKIDSYCRLLNVWDETPERKIVLLLSKATSDPLHFLNTIVKSEQTVITEISHALQLNVISIEGNTFQYVKENRIIYTTGSGKMSQERKMETFASWLQTSEGNSALTELRTKLELAKEQELK